MKKTLKSENGITENTITAKLTFIVENLKKKTAIFEMNIFSKTIFF